jgi:TfoX/Sxy family transcriptional regulator of competence genes
MLAGSTSASPRFPELLARVQAACAGLPAVRPRRMFGCDAFFAGEKIFAVIWTDGRLALKLPEPAQHAELLGRPGAEPWRPYGSRMGNWVLAPGTLADDPAALRLWLERAHAPALAESGAPRRPRPRRSRRSA